MNSTSSALPLSSHTQNTACDQHGNHQHREREPINADEESLQHETSDGEPESPDSQSDRPRLYNNFGRFSVNKWSSLIQPFDNAHQFSGSCDTSIHNLHDLSEQFQHRDSTNMRFKQVFTMQHNNCSDSELLWNPRKSQPPSPSFSFTTPPQKHAEDDIVSQYSPRILTESNLFSERASTTKEEPFFECGYPSSENIFLRDGAPHRGSTCSMPGLTFTQPPQHVKESPISTKSVTTTFTNAEKEFSHRENPQPPPSSQQTFPSELCFHTNTTEAPQVLSSTQRQCPTSTIGWFPFPNNVTSLSVTEPLNIKSSLKESSFHSNLHLHTTGISQSGKRTSNDQEFKYSALFPTFHASQPTAHVEQTLLQPSYSTSTESRRCARKDGCRTGRTHATSMKQLDKLEFMQFGSKNKPLNEAAVNIMEQWYQAHVDNPYPSNQEKEVLAKQGHLTLAQVNSWFANRRNRSNNTRPKKNRKQLQVRLFQYAKELEVTTHGLLLAEDIIERLNLILNEYLM